MFQLLRKVVQIIRYIARVFQIWYIFQIVQGCHITVVVDGHQWDNALHIFIAADQRGKVLKLKIGWYTEYTHVALPSRRKTQLIVNSKSADVIFRETGFRVKVKLCCVDSTLAYFRMLMFAFARTRFLPSSEIWNKY